MADAVAWTPFSADSHVGAPVSIPGRTTNPGKAACRASPEFETPLCQPDGGAGGVPGRPNDLDLVVADAPLHVREERSRSSRDGSDVQRGARLRGDHVGRSPAAMMVGEIEVRSIELWVGSLIRRYASAPAERGDPAKPCTGPPVRPEQPRPVPGSRPGRVVQASRRLPVRQARKARPAVRWRCREAGPNRVPRSRVHERGRAGPSPSSSPSCARPAIAPVDSTALRQTELGFDRRPMLATMKRFPPGCCPPRRPRPGR